MNLKCWVSYVDKYSVGTVTLSVPHQLDILGMEISERRVLPYQIGRLLPMLEPA